MAQPYAGPVAGRLDPKVFVAAPRAVVYAYLADPGYRPEWQGSLRRVELVDDGPPRPGMRWVDHPKVGPPFELQITAMEQDRLWAEEGAAGPFTATGALVFADDTRDGVEGTVVRCVARVRGRGWARPLGPVATVLGRLLVRHDLGRAARILAGT